MRNLEGQLIKAVNNNDLKAVKYLIAAGANISAANSAALNWACWANHIEIASLLIEKGAKINSVALNWSAEQGRLEALKLLVEHGAYVENLAADRAFICSRNEAFEYLTNQIRLQKLKRLENV
jgi:ankyrin repeat protein